MDMIEKWKVYDLGRTGHKPPHQRRYFIARDIDHPDKDHRYIYEVAVRVEAWKNSWEDVIKAISLRP